MFNCRACKQSIGPSVKPIRVVTGTRRVEYHNEYFVEDEWGNLHKKEVDSFGTEITGEALVCADDASQWFNIDTPAPKPPRPAPITFHEKQAEPLRNTFAYTMFNNALERTNHTSKRAERDGQVAMPIVKFFVDNNKDIIL